MNEPETLGTRLAALEKVRDEFNSEQKASGKKISLADVIVLGGCAAVEAAAKKAGIDVQVPFHPGRTDATAESTEVDSVAFLEPTADGFRNFVKAGLNLDEQRAEERLLDLAYKLTLTAPEMTALVGGMRALGVTTNKHGLLSAQTETLSNDFFVNLLDMATKWEPTSDKNVYQGVDRKSGAAKWTATRVDLVFGSNSQLRAISEVYASADGKPRFVKAFVAAWAKVMDNDRYDL